MRALFDIVFTISHPGQNNNNNTPRLIPSYFFPSNMLARELTISDGCGQSDSCFTPSVGLALKSTFASRHGAERALGPAAIRSKALETEAVAG